jgi:hypothetical protein
MCEGPFQATGTALVQLNKVLYRWFTAVYSEGKPVVGPMKIEKGKSFYTEIKITGM